MKRLAVLAVAMLALTGCSHNTDPRKGRVVLEDTSCLYSSCLYSWKVCLGPDLHTHIDGAGDRVDRNAKECRP